MSDKDRRRLYTITALGRQQLEEKLAGLDRVVKAGLQRLRGA
jgi:DNA-binding PadR family transcriptional regulator